VRAIGRPIIERMFDASRVESTGSAASRRRLRGPRGRQPPAGSNVRRLHRMRRQPGCPGTVSLSGAPVRRQGGSLVTGPHA
jgi:hypothetical protein